MTADDSPIRRRFRHRLVGLPARLLGAVVSAYRWYLSPLLGSHCRFYPSCSRYAIVAFARHGALRGGVLAVKRLLSCHPLHPGGFDPVPERPWPGAGGVRRSPHGGSDQNALD